MYVLICQESGLDCGPIKECNTKEGFLKKDVCHTIEKHEMRAEDIYVK